MARDPLMTPYGCQTLHRDLLGSRAWHHRSHPGYARCQALSIDAPRRDVAEYVTERLRAFDRASVCFRTGSFPVPTAIREVCSHWNRITCFHCGTSTHDRG